MLKIFTKYVSFNIIGMLGISCYILADTFFVAKALGALGLASLNFAIAVYSIMNGAGLMIGIGGATAFSIFKGKGENKNNAFLCSVISGAVFAFIFIMAALLFSEDISFLLGADKSTVEYTNIYIKTLLLFSPFFLLNNIVITFVRNDNNPQLAMFAMLVSSFSNIILDYIFMFIFSWEMFGAVIATCFSPIISLLILSLHFIRKKNTFKLNFNKVNFSEIFNVLKLGTSSLVCELASSVSLIVFNLILAKTEGNIDVAAYGIIANIAFVVTSVFTGIAQGTQPLVSTCYGSGEFKKLSEILKLSVISSAVLSAIIYVILFAFTNEVVSAFSENDVILENIAISGVRLYFTGFFFAGINIVATAILSASSKYKTALLLSVLRSCIVLIPAVIIMNAIIGIIGIWLSFTITELIVFAVVIVCTKGLFVKKDKD